jgi:hypothetical protein
VSDGEEMAKEMIAIEGSYTLGGIESGLVNVFWMIIWALSLSLIKMTSSACLVSPEIIMIEFETFCVHQILFFETVMMQLEGDLSPLIDAKLLISLKYMSYGTAINAFRDYFKMGESTSRLCLHHFVRGVLSCDDIRTKYFRTMSSSDAKRVERMHHEVHGVHGMAYSLDCSHFFWGKCSTKYHGQYKGKDSWHGLFIRLFSLFWGEVFNKIPWSV